MGTNTTTEEIFFKLLAKILWLDWLPEGKISRPEFLIDSKPKANRQKERVLKAANLGVP